MHTGKTHINDNPDLLYAIVFDDGSVGLYLANTAKQVAPDLKAAQELYGDLKEYKRGMPISGRAKTVLPEQLSISDEAYHLLVPVTVPATLPVTPAAAEPPRAPDDEPPKPPDEDPSDPLGVGRKRRGER